MRVLILTLCLLFSFSLHAQDVLSIDECIEIALNKNIELKKAQNNLIISKAERFQAVMNYLPSVNASGGYYIRNGNFFDNTVDRFITETTRSFNAGASANIILFNGLRNKHILQSSRYSLEASESSVESQKLSVKSNVLQSYLSVLVDKENIKISNDRIGLLEAQLDRAKKRESVGVGNLEDVFNLQSQLADERLNNVNLQNQLQSDFLSLIQILQLDPLIEYDVEDIGEIDELSLAEIDSYEQILNEALGFSPELKRSESQFLSTKYDYFQTYSLFMPTVNAFYSYNTGYSSNGAINPESGLPEADANFFTQLRYNVQPYLGLQFNLPIFSRFTNRTSNQRAKVNMMNAELDIESAKLTITNTVQQVYQDLIAAQSTYQAAKENLEALEQSFNYSAKRYETGNTDFYTYLESLNNKNRAEIRLVNAKYGIIIRKKVLELYRGLGS